MSTNLKVLGFQPLMKEHNKYPTADNKTNSKQCIEEVQCIPVQSAVGTTTDSIYSTANQSEDEKKQVVTLILYVIGVSLVIIRQASLVICGLKQLYQVYRMEKNTILKTISNVSDNQADKSTVSSTPADQSTGKTEHNLTNRQGLIDGHGDNNQAGNDLGDSGSGKLMNSERDDDIDQNLHGLFYIGSINREPHRPNATAVDTFLLCRAFWTNHGLLTENCVNNVSNVLEVIHSEKDIKILKKTKNIHSNNLFLY